MPEMTTVKVTKDLRDRLASLAKAEGRTMVAELRALLIRREYELGVGATALATPRRGHNDVAPHMPGV